MSECSLRPRKPRIIWAVDAEFDKEVCISARKEMVRCLQQDFDVQVIGGYRVRKLQPVEFDRKIVYFGHFGPKGLKLLSRLVTQSLKYSQVATEFKPDVVLVTGFNPLLVKLSLVKRKDGKPVVIYDVRTLPVDRNPLRRFVFGLLQCMCLRLASREASGVSYISDEMRRYCLTHYRLPEHPSVVWTSGVNIQLFSPAPMPLASALRLIYHGSVARNRHVSNVVRALALVKDLDVRLTIVGSGDGIEEIQQLTVQLGLEDVVSISGAVPYNEVPGIISRCHCGILPFPNLDCWNTSSPIKLFEYLACGRPVIATEIPAHLNVLSNSRCVFWARDSTPASLALAIRKAYQNKHRLAELSAEALRLALQNTWERQSEKLKRFIFAALAKKAELVTDDESAIAQQQKFVVGQGPSGG